MKQGLRLSIQLGLFLTGFLLGGVPCAQASTITCPTTESSIATPGGGDTVTSSCSGLRLNRATKNITYTPAYVGATAYCLSNNNTGTDYFVPARSKDEWDSFYATAEGLGVKITDSACCPTTTIDAAGETWCAIPPTGVTGCHRYLYYMANRDAWYISPENCTGWSWNYYTAQTGTYTYGIGSTATGSFYCSGGEGGGWGIGCSSGGGNRLKVLTIYSVSPSTNTGVVCQDLPGLFGGPGRHIGPGLVCATGANFYYSTDSNE